MDVARPSELAFLRVIEPHLARLALHLRRRAAPVLGPDCDEDDLAQTVLATAWRGFPTFEDRGPAATWGWLLALCDGAVADRAKYRRAKGRDQVRHLESAHGQAEPGGEPDAPFIAPSVGTSVTRLAARRELRALVDAAIDGLEPGQRDVVVRYLVHGASLSEVAAALGVTKNAVWERLHRGLDRLRAALPALP